MQLRPLSAVVAATQTYSRGRKERAGGGVCLPKAGLPEHFRGAPFAWLIVLAVQEKLCLPLADRRVSLMGGPVVKACMNSILPTLMGSHTRWGKGSIV